jgi:hypothetical protein
MGDFLTRLAERTLGVAPVVQPMIATVFAPEPTGHSADLEWDGEATTSSGDLGRVQAPPAQETPPTSAAPTGRPEDAAMAQQGDYRNLSPVTPGPPQRTPDTLPEPLHPAAPAPASAPAERGVTPIREDRRSLSPGMPKRPQRAPDAQPEPHHPAESGPARRDVDTASSGGVLPEDLPSDPSSDPSSDPLLAEGFSAWATSRPIKTLVNPGEGATLPPVPSPGARASASTRGDIPGPKATLDRPASPAAALPITPRIVHPQLNAHAEPGPQEPRVAAPEPPSPTIRVAIGRIEVRAITPPPPMPPAQRRAPARPGPALSLDDYLEQRNGGQR